MHQRYQRSRFHVNARRRMHDIQWYVRTGLDLSQFVDPWHQGQRIILHRHDFDLALIVISQPWSIRGIDVLFVFRHDSATNTQSTRNSTTFVFVITYNLLGTRNLLALARVKYMPIVTIVSLYQTTQHAAQRITSLQAATKATERSIRHEICRHRRHCLR